MQDVQSRSGVATPVIGIVIGVILVVLGQFFLDKLADSSDTWHWIQHGVLFIGGIAIGAAGALLYVRGQQRV
jgi:hypothetical protein